MNSVVENLFANLPVPSAQEDLLTLLQTEGFRIERIISNGQSSPPDFWYDQEQNEWVLLLTGTATIKFEDGASTDLCAGDYFLLESHVKHRVERTSTDAIWLAVHYP